MVRRLDRISLFVQRSLSFLAVIDPTIPALKCELLPESSSEEMLFVSISPFSGLYKVFSYMGNARGLSELQCIRHCSAFRNTLLTTD